ncbi:hypothetical protein HYQ44_012529 [Verticillium longisporum]|nr:hypothetical protein HYQ44_012529 [Verticillium longisporum]
MLSGHYYQMQAEWDTSEVTLNSRQKGSSDVLDALSDARWQTIAIGTYSEGGPEFSLLPGVQHTQIRNQSTCTSVYSRARTLDTTI